MMLFGHHGYCPICEAPAWGVAEQTWLRYTHQHRKPSLNLSKNVINLLIC